MNDVVNLCNATGGVNGWVVKAPYERCEYDSINGMWAGKGHKTPLGATGLASSSAIAMNISGDGGTIDYPDLHCGGMIARIGEGGRSGVFREHITYGVEQCVDGETITVSLRNGQLDWSRDGTSGDDSAAVLARSH